MSRPAVAPPPAPPPPAPPITRRELLVLVLILLVGLAFRIREAVRTPFWFDELFTLWIAGHPLPDMFRLLAGDIHPPLPSLLVSLWLAIGGDGRLWLKTLPMLFGLATVLATFGFARTLFGRGAGLLAAALIALHPMHIYFSQELRSYGMLALALLLSAWAAWSWLATGRTRAMVYGALATAFTFYTHYLGGIVLVLLDVLVLAIVSRAPRRRMAGWVLVHVGVLALMIPLSGLLPSQMRLAGTHWVNAATWENLFDFARKTAFGSLYLLPVLALMVALPFLRADRRRAGVFALWMGLVPVLFAFFATRAGGHLFAERYMFFTVPYWCTLFAAGLLSLRGRALAVAASLAVLVLAARAAVLWSPHQEAVALRRVADRMRPRLAPGDYVFCTDTHSLMALDHHLRDRRGVLVMSWSTLPYYLGAAIVPESRRVPPDSLRHTAARGVRWWAVRVREGGVSTVAAAALLDSLARGGREQYGQVTLWAGAPGMLDGHGPPDRPEMIPAAK